MLELHDKRGVYLYGSVALVRDECPKCKRFGFVRNGKSVCCNQKIEESKLLRTYRVSEAPSKRRRPGKQQRNEILALQQYECLYCGQKFGSVHTRQEYSKRHKVTLRLHWDHFVPFSFSQNNYAYNHVAACHVCNGIKGALHFSSVLDAMVYIRLKRAMKGYDF